MGWRDNLLPASFRGASFKWDNSGADGGRRLAVHEFIARDLPYPEDLGGKTKQFSMVGYVLGDDYMAARDALFAACNAEGPGQLIHPTLGTIEVVCPSVSYSETKTEGGVCRFTMTFIESGRQQYPTAAVDRSFALSTIADKVSTAATNDFLSRLVVTDVPEFVRDVVRGETVGISDVLTGLGFPGAPADVIGAFKSQAAAMITDVETLVRSPVELANRIVAMVKSVTSVGNQSTASTATLLAPLTNYAGLGVNLTTTPSQTFAQGNREAMVDLTQTVAVAEQAKAVAAASYTSYDEAVASRTAMVDKIDELADVATDEVYVELQALRAEVVQAVPVPDEDLPRITSIALPDSLPGIVLGYGLYDDAERDSEIVARNRVRHPGFLPSNRKLQVLTDG